MVASSVRFTGLGLRSFCRLWRTSFPPLGGLDASSAFFFFLGGGDPPAPGEVGRLLSWSRRRWRALGSTVSPERAWSASTAAAAGGEGSLPGAYGGRFLSRLRCLRSRAGSGEVSRGGQEAAGKGWRSARVSGARLRY